MTIIDLVSILESLSIEYSHIGYDGNNLNHRTISVFFFMNENSMIMFADENI
jgi:hypothetical protein